MSSTVAHTLHAAARVTNFLDSKTPSYSNQIGGPKHGHIRAINNRENIEDLREKLLERDSLMNSENPEDDTILDITVRGTLFTCALLRSGWWDRREPNMAEPVFVGDGIQRWLFQGFNDWAPSWDFVWGDPQWHTDETRRYLIAQIGHRDEADSLPVLLPRSKALRLMEKGVLDNGWGGMEVEIRGIVGHRRVFEAKHHDAAIGDIFGGLLDYCFWVDEDNRDHYIDIVNRPTQVYSGYAWKCVAPYSLVGAEPKLEDITLDKVYFLWDHTNFADKDARSYSLDALEAKQRFVERRHGVGMHLIQKSSSIVPGTPKWKADEIYKRVIQGRVDRV